MRVTAIVLDSCGCGAAPDAAQYGDDGADTIGHVAAAVGGLRLPTFEAAGYGAITDIKGVPRVPAPAAAVGRMRERSGGKDTTTGHWEMMGVVLPEPFPTFTETGFPDELVVAFSDATGRGVLGNIAASGTEIIERLGPTHIASGDLILYTSADSVFQVAAHEEVVPVPELYRICKSARRLCDPYRIGRVIARPFIGAPGGFRRTYNRKDFAMAPPAPTVLDRLAEAGIATVGVGKIGDIFSGRGLAESHHTEGDADGIDVTGRVLDGLDHGFCFVNLVDLDMTYGHRRDVPGYARGLALVDQRLPELLDRLAGDDLLLITADHGTDPTFPGSDHTREDVPIVAWGRAAAGRDLGVRDGFWDLGATVAEAFGIAAPGGTSFLADIT